MARAADTPPSERLERELCRVLEGPLLPYEKVIRACERLSAGVLGGAYVGWTDKTGAGAQMVSGHMQGGGPAMGGPVWDRQAQGSPIGQGELALAAYQISRAVLSDRVRRELGEDPAGERRRYPLGVLLHLGAGNVPGLGAYSVIEGLLAGNVNLLKPSGKDREVSIFLLKELVRLEPELKPYIHVFPISSDREETIRRLMEMADGVVVWGSDETVRQVRTMAGPDKRLIEWGHRFSFVYCTEQGLKAREKVRELALHILKTQQRSCSSCQAVFLDTERTGAAKEAARLLQGEIHSLQAELGWDEGQIAQMTLRGYTAGLEDVMAANVTGICADTRSWAGGCPVLCLPRHRLIRELRRIRLSLQTAGLICKEEEWEELSYRLLRAGAVRVKRPGQMDVGAYGDYRQGQMDAGAYGDYRQGQMDAGAYGGYHQEQPWSQASRDPGKILKVAAHKEEAPGSAVYDKKASELAVCEGKASELAVCEGKASELAVCEGKASELAVCEGKASERAAYDEKAPELAAHDGEYPLLRYTKVVERK